MTTQASSRISDERNCRYVNSRGILKSCDVFPNPPVSSVRQLYGADWESLKPGDVVYVHGSAIPEFCRLAIKRIKVPIVLVSGDCDETVPHDLFASEPVFRSFIEYPLIAHWFSQNCAIRHPKCTPIPIGLDYHTLATGTAHPWGQIMPPIEQERSLQAIADCAPDWEWRQPIAYCNFQFLTNTKFGADRRSALAHMAPEALDLEPAFAERLTSWSRQSRCAFVVSPHGNGLDCHRTWEAVALGCIPIMRHSPLDPLFEGLPVLLVKRWQDVTPDLLRAVHENPPAMTQPEKLTLAYWMRLIRERQTLVA